jgi:probable rRNA maturation factor
MPIAHPMRYEIDFTDQQQLVSLDRDRLLAAARDLLRAEQVASAAIGLVFVDDAAIQRLNREHLQHDYPTDVISFLLEERRLSQTAPSPSGAPRGAGKHLEGEVIVSTQTALAAAKKYGWRTDEEILLYVVHGMLHLAGYDDLAPGERRLMRQRESEILASWGLVPPRNDMNGEPPAEHTAASVLPREGSR